MTASVNKAAFAPCVSRRNDSYAIKTARRIIVPVLVVLIICSFQTVFAAAAPANRIKSLIKEQRWKDLIETGKPAVQALIEALKDNDPVIRERSAFVLGVINDPRAVDPLIDILNNDTKNVQKSAVQALANIRDARAVPSLAASLKNRDKVMRGLVSNALIKINDPKTQAMLIPLLKQDDEGVIEDVARTLGKFSEKDIDPILKALKSDNRKMRTGAAKTLKYASIKYSEGAADPMYAKAVKALADALKDKSRDVRLEAVRTFGVISKGDPEVVKPLSASLADPDKKIRKEAKESLKNIIGEDLGDNKEKWLDWIKKQ